MKSVLILLLTLQYEPQIFVERKTPLLQHLMKVLSLEDQYIAEHLEERGLLKTELSLEQNMSLVNGFKEKMYRDLARQYGHDPEGGFWNKVKESPQKYGLGFSAFKLFFF